MTNKRFWLGMLALVLIFGMTVLGCGGDDDDDGDDPNSGIGGTLTVTGIPAEYNGNYALFQAEKEYSDVLPLLVLLGCKEVNTSTGKITLVQISNGKVDLPMWYFNEYYDEASDDYISTPVQRYSGNDTLSEEMDFIIFSTANPTDLWDDIIIRGDPFSVNFTKGSATITWSSIVFDDSE